MNTVSLDTGTARYDILIGQDLLGDVSVFTPAIRGTSVFVISNATVADLYLPQLTKTLAGYRVDHHLIGDGESFKTLETLESVIGALLAARHTRQTTIIALGGGVVGDTAGFAAATYQRGVPFIQVPTTLLSQVDSSVGGKTAVNHPLGKNMIGAFYQPRRVVIDTATLGSLPPRELSAGLAEVIKHGVLADWDYFEWLEANREGLMALDPAVMTQAIRGSCEIKARIVAQDEKESGVRALLNLGHTFGHAIESAQGYGSWLHGEAVGAGLVMAADLSCRMNMISTDIAHRIKQLVRDLGLPVAPPAEMTPEAFLTHMAVDKKATEAGLRFVLVQEPGRAVVSDAVPADLLKETLTAGGALCGSS